MSNEIARVEVVRKLTEAIWPVFQTGSTLKPVLRVGGARTHHTTGQERPDQYITRLNDGVAGLDAGQPLDGGSSAPARR